MTLYYKPDGSYYPRYEQPEVCPFCNRPTSCSKDCSATLESSDGRYDFIRYKCQCSKNFFAVYLCPPGTNGNHTVKPISVFPSVKPSIGEATKLEFFSPEFVSIYAEVVKARQIGLTTLVGPGLRKAVEFLIKDYLLYINALSEEQLRSTSLRNCINSHLNDENLISVADAAAIVGNNETHWFKNNPEYEIDDMQLFTDVAISLMSSRLAIEKAKKLRQEAQAKKRNANKQVCNATDQDSQHTDKEDQSDH